MRCQFLLAHSCFVQREIRAKSGPRIANSSLNANLGFSDTRVHTKAQLRFEKQPELALKCLHSLFSRCSPGRAQLLPMAKAASQRKICILPVLRRGVLHPAAPQGSAEFPWEAVPGFRRSWNHQGVYHILEKVFPELFQPGWQSPNIPWHIPKASGQQVGKFLLQTSNCFLLLSWTGLIPPALYISSYFN